jgi:hypothetical protein
MVQCGHFIVAVASSELEEPLVVESRAFDVKRELMSYEDAFGMPRFVQFCFVYGGDAGVNPQGAMATYRYWNEAN